MRCWILFAFFIFLNVLYSAEQLIDYTHLGREQGLNQVTVTDIAQSKDGLIWIATLDGINQFDGYEVKQYYLNRAKKSSLISRLILDKNDQLNAISNDGLYQYDKILDRFISVFSLPNEENVGVLKEVASDKDSFWLGTNTGYIFLIKDNKVISSYKLRSSKNNDGRNKIEIRSLVVDESSRVWVGTNKGLWLKGKNHTGFIEYTSSKDSSFKSLKKPVKNLDLFNNYLLIATYEGLYGLNLVSNQLDLIIGPKTHELPKERTMINQVVSFSNSEVILATQKGALKYDFLSKKIHHLTRTLNTDTSIMVNRVFVDNQNSIWVGTELHGAFYGYYNRYVKHYSERSFQDFCNLSNVIYAIRAIDDKLIIGSWGRGLSVIEIENNSCKNLVSDKADINSYLKRAVSFEIGKERELWIGTSGGGLIRYDLVSDEAKHYLPDQSKFGISDADVFAIEFDGEDKVWFGTSGGLSSFSYSKNQFEHFYEAESSLFNNKIYSLELAGTSLWIGTQYGIDRLNTSTLQFERDSLDSELKSIKTTIYDLELLENGGLAIATLGDGLYFASKDNIVNHFHSENRLPSNTVYRVLQDESGRVWGSSNNGIFVLENDFTHLLNITVDEGLQGSEFTTAADISKNNDKLYFAGLNGFNEFNTISLTTMNNYNRPIIRDFYLNNRKVELDKVNRFTDGKSLLVATRINLSYRDSVVGFDFSAPNFIAPLKIKYRYKLEGLHQEWLPAEASNKRAVYTNLPHGDFRLLVNASDIHGNWTDQYAALEIRVSPPFWLTWWAKLLYALTIIFSPIVIYYYRSQALRKRAEMLEISVKERTQELAVQKNIVEKLLQQKNNEFINISHEFRTPLTLILGPVKRLFEKVRPEEHVALNLIQTNAERLLKLVDELLEIEKLKIDKALPKQVYILDSLLIEIVHAYEYAAQSSQLSFVSYIEEGICVEVLHDSIEKILSNLLSNAIKYNVHNGSIQLSITSDSSLLKIRVSDTGIGMANNIQERIFKKFERGDNRPLQAHGSGVGLSVVQEIVHAHGGSIWVQSRENVGTEFEIEMPCVIERSSKSFTRNGKQQDSNRSLAKESIEQFEIDDNKPVVLVIEDDPQMRQYIYQVICENYQCVTAIDGESGLQIAEDLIPDIVICDVMMPGISGHQVCKSLKENNKTSHIPMLMLTARIDKASRMQSWKLLADEYLTKPFEDDELIVRVSSLLRLRENLQSFYSQVSLGRADAKFELDFGAEVNSAKSDKDADFVCRINQILNENYESAKLSVGFLSAQLYMSERQLRRKIKALMGLSPVELIKQFRLEKAILFLRDGEAPSVVSLKAGFSSHSYFSQEFKKYTGQVPGEFS
ncbi:hybrid sensor histidine kinase/response regulator transcription factor [Pleionea sediminis]|uniref:hybrid sensor histidine kinase/response regulator transcription factor n=1 Tax=Pleionea sediminis TaxID=2569479 RepID=UPI0011859565|nr:hybrid sensor histidine kinase/response regulator transcription factor [Pleionea sediminis]